MKNFFNHFYFEEYVPHVRHIIYPVLIMTAGYRCILEYDWILFGWIMFLLGIALFTVISFGIAWRGPIEYWRQVESVTKVLMKINSPEIWHALGFKEVPKSSIEMMERKVDEKGNFTGFEYKHLSVNAVMLNTIANKILLSGKPEFTEERFKKIIPNFRKTKKEFLEKGFITQSSKHPKAPYVMTKKGMEKVVYMYADQAIKLQVEKERNNG